MPSNFDSVFRPELKWQDKRLSDSSPCKDCPTGKQIAEEMRNPYSMEKRPDSCNVCIPYLNWKIDCMAKLGWYEDHDKRLKADNVPKKVAVHRVERMRSHDEP